MLKQDIDLKKTYKTRSGYDVVLYAIVPKAAEGEGIDEYRVHGRIDRCSGASLASWTITGDYCASVAGSYDLVEVVPTQTVYVNVYNGDITSGERELWFSEGYKSRADADTGFGTHDTRYACLKLEIEKGRFDK